MRGGGENEWGRRGGRENEWGRRGLRTEKEGRMGVRKGNRADGEKKKVRRRGQERRGDGGLRSLLEICSTELPPLAPSLLSARLPFP